MRRTIQLACASASALLFAALPAAAQCVMCYKTVAGAGARTIAFLKLGIIIMLIPTLFIFAALALMVYRRRKSSDQNTDGPERESPFPTTSPETMLR